MKKTKTFLVISILSVALGCFAVEGNNDLLTQAKQVFGQLPKAMESEKNPITPEKVKLGKMLFYETRISADGTVSCARCHPLSLYGADGLKKSIGSNCRVNIRNAPTVLNAADLIAQNWTGNRTDFEDGSKKSVINPLTYAMPSHEAAEKILKGIEGYRPLFEAAFPADKDPVNIDNFAKAVGAFGRTLVTPSPFDDFLAGKQDALTQNQKQGLKSFMDLGCAGCHSGAFIGGKTYTKFGIAQPYWKYTKSEPVDNGRYEITKQEDDKYVFKVPDLRNVVKASPYFHDGSVARLDESIRIMSKVQLDKDLAEPQLADISAFLESLTGQIPDDAMEIPILPATR